MIRIAAIAYTAYPVTEISRARAFYEGLLGLRVSREFEHEGRHWIEYDIGPGTLAVSNMSSQWTPSANGPSIALDVEDFEQATATLRGAGVKFLTEPRDTGVCLIVLVADPDGNALILHKKK